MHKLIRKHLVSDTELINLLAGEYIWLSDKPKNIKTNTYIRFTYRELDKNVLTRYQVEFNIISDDLNKAIDIKERLIKLLHNERNSVKIEGIKQSRLLNGGGMLYHEKTGEHELICYFLVIKQ